MSWNGQERRGRQSEQYQALQERLEEIRLRLDRVEEALRLLQKQTKPELWSWPGKNRNRPRSAE